MPLKNNMNKIAQKLLKIAEDLGKDQGIDRSVNPTVIQYAIQSMLKGKSVSAAAKYTAKKLSGKDNFFIGTGISIINATTLEAALLDYMADEVIKNLKTLKEGQEYTALISVLNTFNQDEKVGKQLKGVVTKKLGSNPWKTDERIPTLKDFYNQK